MVCGDYQVRLFAGLRERAGYSEREVVDVTRVADVWPALDLGDEPEGLLYAVNREYADAGRELADGDEVAVIPPCLRRRVSRHRGSRSRSRRSSTR
jgi:molybdopterin converting factor small subunit